MTEGEKQAPGSVCRCPVLWRRYLLSRPTSITFTQQPRCSPSSLTFLVVRRGLSSPSLAGTVFPPLMLPLLLRTRVNRKSFPCPSLWNAGTLGETQDGHRGERIEEVSGRKGMLPTPTSAWHLHLLCPGSQTKSLAVAHSYRKRFWRRPCGSTASDVSYLDTRTRPDSQTGGTNGPQSPSQALRFLPWLLFNMLQVGILLCDMEDVYLFSGTWWGALLSLDCNLDIAFHWVLGLIGCGVGQWMGEMSMGGSPPQFLVLPRPT